MAHVVTSARDAVRTALQAALPGVTWTRRHWVKVSPDQLPRGFVITPKVLTDRYDHTDVAREVTFQVVIKREGGEDLETVLDDDSTAVEMAVLPVLDAISIVFGLVETDTNIDGTAKVPVGELNMLFQAQILTPEGNPTV